MAELGKAFGMRTLFSAYKGTTGTGPLYTPFEEVLRTSDIITLHAPLLWSTRNMIGRPEFALMERRPLLIDTARGGLVDEAALAEALTSGRIAGATFDVATVKPPPADRGRFRQTATDGRAKAYVSLRLASDVAFRLPRERADFFGGLLLARCRQTVPPGWEPPARNTRLRRAA